MKSFLWYMTSLLTHILAFCAGLLFLGPHYYYLSPFYTPIEKAVAVIHPTQDNATSGSVTFLQEEAGVRIIADLVKLEPGEHGFHIHEFGNCNCPDGSCAGEHFNPTNQPHAGPYDKNRHHGDLGNITADKGGNARIEFVDTQLQLNGPHSIVGHSVIIHAKADDYHTQETGDSGGRIGCGVIGIAARTPDTD